MLTQKVLEQKEEENRLRITKKYQPVHDDHKNQNDNDKESKWINLMNQEKLEQHEKDEKEKEDRRRRLRVLIEDDSDDDKVDHSKLAGKNLEDYLNKVTNHLNAEQKLLDVWH